MIITKTPYRISFFGGGTDYPEHYLLHGGCVLATSINKFCYISCRKLPPFFDYKFRVSYSIIETTNTSAEILHPCVRAALDYLAINQGVELHHFGDLPARSGLGSSSSFTNGLLNALHTLCGDTVSQYDLAMQAIDVEQNFIGEIVGSQDQVISAVGGLNQIGFNQDGSINVHKIVISPERLQLLESHFLLFFSGMTRNSQTITPQTITDIRNKSQHLVEMGSLVAEGVDILVNENQDILDFGRLMHQSWLMKKSISSNISNSLIDGIYDTAIASGAVGGKLLGAGGGGFVVFFAPPEKHANILQSLSKFIHVPFRFENEGSVICVNHQR